jgi:hypothetical protein
VLSNEDYPKAFPPSTYQRRPCVLLAQARLVLLQQARESVSGPKGERLRQLAEDLDAYTRVLYRLEKARLA